ncbi:hypothetical protein [Paenibacillus sp. OSY-SE]|uniref:hypothetical protein n=1 Tax=Paenibacillus sp. OSY-SE TaxID=1196323 RepID=UPI00030AE66B|nr:hypothetical protein [Paenibacillus sp. OSY-SE]
MNKKIAFIFILAVFLVSSVNAYDAEYSYDENGNIKNITNDDTDITYQADKNGNMTSRSVSKKVYEKVTNSDFKNVNNAGKAIGWSYVTDREAVSSYGIQKIGSRNHQQIQASNMPIGSSIGIKQTISISADSNKYLRGMKSSLKIEHLQNAEAIMALEFVDDNGKVIERVAKKSTLTSNFFYTISEKIGSVPDNAKKAVIQLVIHATGSNAAGAITIRGVDVTYDYDPFFNLLMNYDFQGEGISTIGGTISDYWDDADNTYSSRLYIEGDKGGKRSQVVGRHHDGGSKEIYISQNILLDDKRKYQIRGISHRVGDAESHLRILFFNQHGTLMGTNYTSSDSLTNMTVSIRGSIPKGTVYATIFVGARFDSDRGFGHVHIDGVTFEYSIEPQALWNSFFTIFDKNSDIAQGWEKINGRNMKEVGIYGKGDRVRGQKITVPLGQWGQDSSAGILQIIRVFDDTFSSKFSLRGEIFIQSSKNAKLEVKVELYPKKINMRVPTQTETYMLTPENHGQVVSIEGEIPPGIAKARISARLVPINPDEPWEASVVVHDLRFNPFYNPSSPVEMFLPEGME